MFNNTRETQNSRSSMYKKTVDSEQSRRKREEVSTSIRKNAREDSISKRRQIATQTNVVSDIFIPENYKTQFKQFEEGTLEMKLNNLNNLKNSLYSNEEALVYCAIEQFRKLLSHDQSPPIKEVVELDIVSKLNELLQCSNAKVQCEAAWAITNIASGRGCCEYLHSSGSIHVLFKVLSNPVVTLQVKEQCIWALANIAGESEAYRDILLDLGMMPVLVQLGNLPDLKFEFLQNIVWAISNLCRGNSPLANFSKSSVCLSFLKTLLDTSDYVEILSEVCWTLSYLAEESSDDPEKRIPTIVEAGVVPRLVELLGSEETAIYTPALRAIGNVLTGDKHATRACLDSNVLQALTQFLTIKDDGKFVYRATIRKEACWSASNIAAGSPKQIEEFVSERPLITALLKVAKTDLVEVKRETFFALTNACNGRSPVISALVDKYDILKVFRNGLRNYIDIKTTKIILEALKVIIETGEDSVKKTTINSYLETMIDYDFEAIISEVAESLDPKHKQLHKLIDDILSFFITDMENGENFEPNQPFEFSRPTSTGNYDI